MGGILSQGEKQYLTRSGRDRNDHALQDASGSHNGGALLPPHVVTQIAQSTAPESREESLLEIVWRQRKTVALTAILCLVAAFVYLLVATPKYRTSASLYVQKASPALLGDAARSSADQQSDNYRYTQCELLRSTPILALALGGPGMDELPMFDGVRNRIAWLKDQVSAEVGKRDDLITVSMDHPDRDSSEKVIGNVVQAYIAYQSNEKRSSAAEATEILQKEKAKRDAELSAKIKELNTFQQANQALGIEGNVDRSNVVMQRLNTLSEALTRAHLDFISAKTAYDQVLKAADMTDEDAAASTVVSLSASDEERLRGELFAMTQRLDELKRNYMESHPVIRAVESRVKQLNGAMVSVVRQRMMVAQFQEQELQKAFDEQQKLATVLAAKSADLGRLNDEIRRLEGLSDNLDNRIKELAVVEEAGALNISVIEPAASLDSPISPDKGKILAGALILGLLLGSGMGLLREWVDPRLSSAEDVKSALGLNVIASLPRMPASQSPEAHAWAVHLNPMSEAAEACRALRTAMMYGNEGRWRTIVITSPAGGEGKTTLAGNLAIALAKAGKKVLIVDVNFHRPTIHRIFGVNDEPGLSGVLTNAEPIEQAVRRTAVERLDVLPAGALPAGQEASELFNSEAFNNVLEGLSSVYDHVVLDAPAVSVLDDARIVAAACDATLLIMRLDHSSRRLAEKAREGLVNVGAQIAGAVINDAPRRLTIAGLQPALATEDARPIVQRIAAGLEAAHLHRDGDANGAEHNFGGTTAALRVQKPGALNNDHSVGVANTRRDEVAVWNNAGELSEVKQHST